LLADVERGEEVLISRAGKPVARLVSCKARRPAPVFGADRGKFSVADDVDAPLGDDLLAAFEGRLR
jgi:antitoxin (DNA-binding transcriptional repressor) of toxin-antitoxin stability system